MAERNDYDYDDHGHGPECYERMRRQAMGIEGYYCDECKYNNGGHADNCPAPLRKEISDLKALVREMITLNIEHKAWCKLEFGGTCDCKRDDLIRRAEEAVK